jgi:hypothetical protein
MAGAYWAVFSNLGLIFISFMSARVALRAIVLVALAGLDPLNNRARHQRSGQFLVFGSRCEVTPGAIKRPRGVAGCRRCFTFPGSPLFIRCIWRLVLTDRRSDNRDAHRYTCTPNHGRQCD